MTTALPRFPFNPLQPGGYSYIDAAALIASEQAPNSSNGAVLGASTGGPANTPLYFRDQATAKSVLRSGPLLDCVRLMLAAGTPQVAAVRVGSGIAPSTKALAGATGTPVTLTAVDAGVWTNGFQVTIGAANKVTLAYTDPNTGTVYTEVFDLGADATAQELVDAVNGKNPTIAKSAFVKAAVTEGTMPLTAAAQTAMAGGSDGTLNAADWTAGLVTIESEDISIVCVATGDASIHAAVLTHCNAMSTPQARHERTTVLGGVWGESVAQVTARQAALGDKRDQLVYPGIKMLDLTGVMVNYDPFYAAALVAGSHLALPDPATALTQKVLDQILDVEVRLSTIQGSDVDQLLAAGVTPIAPARGGGFWIVDSLSGYRADQSFRDFHKIRSLDYTARFLREALEVKFVGGKSLVGTPNDIKLEAVTQADSLLQQGIIKAYLEPQISQPDPRTYAVSVPVMAVDTTKYILLTVALLPVSAVQAGSQVDTNALV